MKRLTLFTVFLLILGMAAFGADVDKLSVSGSVGMTFGDDDIKTAPGGMFSSSKTGAFADIAIGTSNDKVEAGLKVSIVPNISRTKGDGWEYFDPQIFKPDETGFSLIGSMITWYDKKMAGQTYKDDSGTTQTFEDIDFNALEDEVEATTGLDFIIKGNPTAGWTVEDDADTLTSDAHRTHAANLYVAVRDAILAEIEGVSTVFVSGGAASTATILPGLYAANPISAGWTSAEKTAADTESDLYNSFVEYVYDVDLSSPTEDSWAASTPLKSAYLRLNGVGGVVDIEFEVNGKAVGVGSMVSSYKATGDAELGLTVGLASGVVPGLSASLLLNQSENAAAVSDSGDTWSDESADVTKSTLGTQLNVGYTADLGFGSAGATVKFGIIDFSAVGESLVIALEPTLAMPDMFGLSVSGELDVLLLGAGTTGLGAGVGVGASIMGISPSVNFYFKNADYGGDESFDFFDAEDVDDSSMMAEFNSYDTKQAMALGVDVAVDLAQIMGMKLVTLNVGSDLFFGDGYTNVGVDGGVDLSFAEMLGAPLTLGFDIGKYAENDLTWAVSLGYVYAELFTVTATLEQTEADVIGYSIGGKVSF